MSTRGVSNRRMVLAVLAALSAETVFASQISPRPTAPAGRLLAAIVKQSGAIVPFAEYRNGRWAAPGETVADLATPWFTRAGAPPRAWVFADIAGTVRSITTSSAVAKTGSHCQSVWSLPASIDGRMGRPNALPGNAGMAISGVAGIDRPFLVPVTSPEGRAVASFVQQRFDAWEDVERKVVPRWPARSDLIMPLRIEMLFRTKRPIGGRHLYWLEATQRYPGVPPDRACQREAMLQAWIAEDAEGRLTVVDRTLSLTDCDRKGLTTSTPLGVVSLDGRTYLIAEELGYEDEAYTIFDASSARLNRLLSVSGGGC